MSPAVPPKRDLRTVAGLRRLVAVLRGPDGCPWDRAQTHDTLRPYIAEEAAEALAALDQGNPADFCDELGDLLFQVLIHVQLAEEEGAFSMSDVVYNLASKLVRRHPHVFSDGVAETAEAVVRQWDDLKRQERGTASHTFSGIPKTLPALSYAQTIQRRAAKAGFAWETDEQAWNALRGALSQLQTAQMSSQQRHEAGDTLFALVNLLRRMDIDAEDALRQAAGRFTRRFYTVETMAKERGIDLPASALATKLVLWQEAKAPR
jgi:tetrapyrrole methylase family protein/MazG family protein